MQIENISDVIFSFSEVFERATEINFEFIYNNYKTNETTINDDVIDFNNFREKKDKFIRINIENPVKFIVDNINPANSSEFYSNFHQNVLKDFIDKDLYENERNFFNKIDNLSPNRQSLILDNKFDDFKNYYNFYSSENDSLSKEDFNNKFDRSRQISLSRRSEINSGFLSKEYPERFNFNNVVDYDSLVSNESVVNDRKNNVENVEAYKTGNLLPNLSYISQEINTGDPNVYGSKNNFYCGFYVEKYILENGAYKFKCARFYDRKPGQAIKEGISVIEDEAVKYGETYRYICYNTYLMTTLEENNRFLLRNYLLCVHPYISNDITCKEFNPPPPPTSFTADFNKNLNTLRLEWRHPSNYENDVKGYQILRRYSLEDPYVIVKQLEGHLETDAYELTEDILEESILKTPGYTPDFYYDESYEKQKLSIYTIRSIDAHGMVSNYGEQIAVYYDVLRDELTVDLVAYEGANASYPNETVFPKSRFFENKIDIVDNLPVSSGVKKVSLYVTPDYGYVFSSGNGSEEKIYKTDKDDIQYQFTFSNLNSLIYRSDKFTITNFG